jgi:hypothetical protein
MDVRQWCLSFFPGYAAEFDPAITLPIEFPVYQHVLLGSTSDALGLLFILGNCTVS